MLSGEGNENDGKTTTGQQKSNFARAAHYKVFVQVSTCN